MKRFINKKNFKNYLNKISINEILDFLKNKKNENKIFGSLFIISIFFSYLNLPFFDSSRKDLIQLFLTSSDSFGLILNNKKYKIAKIGKQITTRIEGATKGSGVLIRRDGDRYTVLTSFHVVKDSAPNENLEIITFDGVTHSWESMTKKKIGKVDLVTITFKSDKFYKIANIGEINNLNIGNNIYISGFPLESSSIPVRLLRVIPGEVLGNTNIFIPDGYQLHYNSNTKPGMSGGAVLDKYGKLVGIHGRTEKQDSDFELYGKNISTGINMAVPISYYKNSLNNKFYKEKKNNKKDLISKNINDYNSSARVYLTNIGNEDKAISLAKRALEIKENSESYFLISKAKYHLGNYEDSLEKISKALNIEPENTIYLEHQGDLKIKLKNYESALEDFSMAIRINQNNPNYYFKRATAKEYIGDYKGAIKDFSTAIKIDPKNLNYSYQRAKAKEYIGDYKGAINDISKTLGFLPINPYYLFERGKIKEKNGKFDEAFNDFSKALSLWNLARIFLNNESYFYQFRGEIKFKLKDYSGAFEDFQKLVYLEPQDTISYFIIADAKYQLNDYQGAIKVINTMIKLKPNKSFGYFIRGNAKYKSKNYLDAINDFSKAIEIRPDNAIHYRNRAFAKYKLQDFESSCNDYNKSIELGYKEVVFPITKITDQEVSWCNK